MPTAANRTPLRRAVRRALVGALALAGVLLPGASPADDRELLRTRTAEPYVFILLDTSASMNKLPTCTQEELDANICETLCTTGDCYSRLGGDDVESKIYQAKQAIYEVIQDAPEMRYGFASFNQDTSRMVAKHWLYEVVSGGVTLPGTNNVYPTAGTDRVFGRTWNCSGNNILDVTAGQLTDGCSGLNPADVFSDSWERERMERYPMLGQLANTTTQFFIRDTNNVRYRVQYSPVSSAGNVYGASTYLANITIGTCPVDPNNACNSPTLLATSTVTLSLVGQFYHHDRFAQRTEPNKGYFSENEQTLDFNADNRCLGWDPNTGGSPSISDPFNTEQDPFTGQGGITVNSAYNLRFPTTHDQALRCEAAAWAYSEGDRIPQDWLDGHDHREEIAERMAPNLVADPSADPDFGVSTYFNDLPTGGEGVLRLLDEDVKPLVAFSRTALGRALKNYKQWWQGCSGFGNACEADISWAKIAAGDYEDQGCSGDPDWLCRRHFLIVITDLPPLGDGESDPYDGCQPAPADADQPDYTNADDPCANVADLLLDRTVPFNSSIETFVINFGRGSTPAQQLQCMAREGSRSGTGVPFNARNKDELVEQLTTLLEQIFEEAASFASAAVPTVQTNIVDKIFLSSFIPLQDAAVWPGRLDSFLKPLPLDDNNLPDRDQACVVGQQSSCFAWDAGDVQFAFDGESGYQPEGFLLQAPLPSELVRFDNDALQVGTGADQRRVFYGRPDDATDLAHRGWFRYPTSDAEWLDLEFVWNITVPTDVPDLPLSANRKAAIADVLEFTLQEKQSLIDQACTAGGQIGLACEVDSDCDTNPGDGDGVCSANAKVQYVLGDVFHSNPAVINPPGDFELFTKDLYWNTELCGQTLAQTQARGEQISYSWYSNKNLCRRVMLAFGSNDGQIHVFDAGIMRDITPDDPTTTTIDERVPADCLLNVPSTSASFLAGLVDDDGAAGDYDFGTGRELFAFVPQSMMPLVKELSEINQLTDQYGVDGTVRIADVFVDPVPTAGVPTCTERAWRTLLLSNYREGGPGIVALDITQADTFDSDNIPRPLADTPEYVASCTAGGAGCDEFCISGDADCAALPFPALRWEFRDLDALGDPADDDGNGVADFAESWSRPVVFRHPVCSGPCDTANEPEDRWLAAFGGGLPETPTNDSSEAAGNWIYLVDVETGQVIYKRGGTGMVTSSPIVGAVPGDISAVDRDSDGIVDALYFGTTAGYVYKVDFDLDLAANAWELDENTGLLVDPAGDAGKYDPFQIFSTGDRPIYQEINAVYVPRERANALLFGTGNRWDLWETNGVEGRFYAIVDKDFEDANRDGVLDAPNNCPLGCTQPLTEALYVGIDPDDLISPVANYLFGAIPDTMPGWYFTLGADEKLITEPFTLAGVSFFTFYDPVEIEISDACAVGGESKIFIVNTVTTTGYAVRSGTDRTRYLVAPVFTTQPYVEPSATKNEPTSSSTANADSWTTELREINADLRKLFPPGARFANYTLDIKTIRSDTGIVFVAPVPVAIEPHNWKEF
jgi:hypothetical protein